MPNDKTLEEQLAAMREASSARTPPEMQANLEAFLADLERTVVAAAVAEGDAAPDFTLCDALTDQPVNLHETLARGPAVLSFYRGDWCPYCNVEVNALQARYEEIRDLGASLFLVGPETREHAATLQEKTGTTIPILYDIDGAAMDAYRLAFTLPEFLRPMYSKMFDFPGRNARTGWKLPIPATYVIGPDHIVRNRYADADYTRRMEPAEVVAALKALSEAAR
jgi:peroxiredoxin